ncbi:MAG: hypothetical protein Q9203_004969 [Teloschistes exilis]
MTSNATTNFEPYTLRPLPPLLPWISDFHLSLLLPIAIHWLVSGFFEVLQTLFGLGLSLLGDGEPETTGSEQHDLAIWMYRVHHTFAALPRLLAFTGVDFKTMAMTMSRSGPVLPVTGYMGQLPSGFDVFVAKAFYWYIVPAFHLAVALLIADASMYCIHRFGHTNKWFYRTDPDFHDVHHQSWGLKANFGAHLSIWDHMMGTYFADQERISKLRRRNRVVAKEPDPVVALNTIAVDLASSSAIDPP